MNILIKKRPASLDLKSTNTSDPKGKSAVMDQFIEMNLYGHGDGS